MQYRHFKAIVQEVESEQEAHLEGCLEDQADDVREEQTSINAPFVLVQFSFVLGLPVLPIGHMQGHQHGGRGHHDELQSPETHLRDGEEVVEAGILTARLPGVAHKVFLLVLPYLLSRRHVHQDPEEEDYKEPNAPDRSRVFVCPTEEPFQKAPIHPPLSIFSGSGSCSTLEIFVVYRKIL